MISRGNEVHDSKQGNRTDIRENGKMMNKKPSSCLPPAQEGRRTRSRNGKAGNGPV
jgi:hypothetical protein